MRDGISRRVKEVNEMLCNLTIQKLEANGVSVLGRCPVDGCGLPVARHRDETAPDTGELI